MIEAVAGLLLDFVGQMGVEHGGVGGAVTQVLFNGAQIDAGLQQMSGIGMAQGMDGSSFLDAAFQQSLSEDDLQAGSGKGRVAVAIRGTSPRPQAGKSQTGLR